MYLHPLIHTELIRQRERGLSRLPLRVDRVSRSLPLKKTAAALAVLLVATIAALALTSGAHAATAKKPSHSGTAPSWRIVQDGTGKITISIGGRIVYVYYPAPTQPLVSSNTDVNDDCVYYQANCTDEQNCQYWGVNCDRIPSTSTDTPAVEQDSSVSDNEGA